MRGVWKNKLSGINSKFNRRKKQTHKHMLKDNAMFISKHFMEGEIETHPNIFKEDRYSYFLKGKELKSYARYAEHTCSKEYIAYYGAYACQHNKAWLKSGYKNFDYRWNSNKFFYNKPAYMHQKHTWTREERVTYLKPKQKFKRTRMDNTERMFLDTDTRDLPDTLKPQPTAEDLGAFTAICYPVDEYSPLKWYILEHEEYLVPTEVLIEDCKEQKEIELMKLFQIYEQVGITEIVLIKGW